MALTKRELPVGEKVRGYGLLNEYGEFEFIPEQTGTRKGKVKQVCQTDFFTLSETRQKVIIHVSFEKGVTKQANLLILAKIINQLLMTFKKYEI